MSRSICANSRRAAQEYAFQVRASSSSSGAVVMAVMVPQYLTAELSMCYGTEQFSAEAHRGEPCPMWTGMTGSRGGYLMKLGLRMAGVGVALLAGMVSTGSTVLAATASPSSTVAVASWDRGGDHHGGWDRGWR